MKDDSRPILRKIPPALDTSADRLLNARKTGKIQILHQLHHLDSSDKYLPARFSFQKQIILFNFATYQKRKQRQG
jgi:hypothetical protein